MTASMMAFISTTPKSGVAISKESFVRAALDEFLLGDSYLPVTMGSTESALSESERGALASIGMARTAATAGNAAAARQQSLNVFFHTYLSALPTKRVAQMLRVSPSRIRQRVRERSLIPLTDGAEMRFPAAWFEGENEVPGLRIVLPALPSDLRPLEALSWWLTPTRDLADANDTPRSPRAYLLAEGNGRAVAALAAGIDRSEAA